MTNSHLSPHCIFLVSREPDPSVLPLATKSVDALRIYLLVSSLLCERCETCHYHFLSCELSESSPTQWDSKPLANQGHIHQWKLADWMVVGRCPEDGEDIAKRL